MHKRFKPAFTIVELLIVVAVIAILATVTIVAYSGIKRQAAISVAQNLLRDAGKAMEVHKVKDGAYPTTLPGSVIPPRGFGLAVAEVSSAQREFCIIATITSYNDLAYSIDQNQNIKEELCTGVILATYGDYNTEADPRANSSPWTTAPTAGHKVAPGDMNFTAQTNDTWTRLTLSWKAMEGATQYRVNHKTSTSSLWRSRDLGTGANPHNWDYNHYAIGPEVTSITWTSSSAMPRYLSETHDYRIQYRNSSNEWSEWQELSLSPMEGVVLPAPTGFKVVPSSDWSRVKVSWDGIGNLANLPNLRFRVNHKQSASSLWKSRDLGTGANSHNWDYTNNSLEPTDTSLTWTSTSAFPRYVSEVHNYRIQLYSSSVEGPWSEFTLDPQDLVPLPAVNDFAVVPNEDWTGLNISWSPVSREVANLPNIYYRVNHLTTPGGTWRSRDVSTGLNTSNWNQSNNSYSSMIDMTSNSLTWTASGSRPTPGKTHYYRIQVYSGQAEGPWTEITLSH